MSFSGETKPTLTELIAHFSGDFELHKYADAELLLIARSSFSRSAFALLEEEAARRHHLDHNNQPHRALYIDIQNMAASNAESPEISDAEQAATNEAFTTLMSRTYEQGSQTGKELL